MATLVRVLIQSPPSTAGRMKSEAARNPAMTAARPAMPCVIRAERPRAWDATLAGRPRERDGAVAAEVEQRDDREHEGRRGAVVRDRGVGRGDRLQQADAEAARE